MKRAPCSTAAALSGLALLSTAQAASLAETEFYGSDDSDNARQTIALVKGATDVAAPIPGGIWLSVAAGTRRLTTETDAEHFKVGRLGVETHPWEKSDIELTVQNLDSNDWNTTLGSARISQDLKHWYLEASVERNIVDTTAAIAQRIRFDSASASVDYRIDQHWTLVFAGLVQDFTDGNDRIGRIGRLVYSQNNDNWNLQLRVRRLDADFRGVGYFSPERLEEALALGKIGGPVFGNRFAWSVQLGAGQQRINGDDSQALYTGELGLRGWFTDHWGMDAKADCSNTGELNAQQADSSYRYCQATLSLKRAW